MLCERPTLPANDSCRSQNLVASAAAEILRVCSKQRQHFPPHGLSWSAAAAVAAAAIGDATAVAAAAQKLIWSSSVEGQWRVLGTTKCLVLGARLHRQSGHHLRITIRHVQQPRGRSQLRASYRSNWHVRPTAIQRICACEKGQNATRVRKMQRKAAVGQCRPYRRLDERSGSDACVQGRALNENQRDRGADPRTLTDTTARLAFLRRLPKLWSLLLELLPELLHNSAW